MGTGNQMSGRAQEEKLLREQAATREALKLAEGLRTILLGIVQNHPVIRDGQKCPTVDELLTHIERPKGYVPELGRGDYLTVLLLTATKNVVSLWHTNGAPVITLEGAKLQHTRTSNRVIAAVKVLRQALQGA